MTLSKGVIMGIIAYGILAAHATAQTQNTKDLLAQLEREQPIVCGGVADKGACNAAFVATIRAIHRAEKQTTSEMMEASLAETRSLFKEIVSFYDEYELRKKGKVSFTK